MVKQLPRVDGKVESYILEYDITMYINTVPNTPVYTVWPLISPKGYSTGSK